MGGVFAATAMARAMYTALVSVQGSQTYWERHGYAQQPLGDAAQRERLASYGAGAVYMARAMAVAANTPPMG